MGLYSRGLIIGRIFASEIWGAYFREGLFFGAGGGGWVRLLSEFYGMSFVFSKPWMLKIHDRAPLKWCYEILERL